MNQEDARLKTRAMATQSLPRMSLAEFLDLPGRHEYHNGEVSEMEASTQNHNRIARNIMNVCESSLAGIRCLIHGIEVAVEISTTGRYVMPDAVIHCDAECVNHQTSDSRVRGALSGNRGL